MKIISIDKTEWNKGLQQSRRSYRLTGPVKDQAMHCYKDLDEDELPDMDFGETAVSPKSILFPPSEVMLSYTTDTESPDCNIMNEVPKTYPDRAVIAIRPCDAKAFQILKLNYDTKEYQDPYWLNAYNACTFIGLADNSPSVLDFSTSCNSGPFDETGLDVLLVDTGDTYLGKILSDKGAAFMTVAGFTTAADGYAAELIGELKQMAESKITSTVAFDKIAEKTVLELFEADHWEETAFACINCGTCTYSCPTCWCFDIQDEVSGTDGVRLKQWDSCMTGQFTLHGSGHNPRDYPWQRTRQRFMHKLKYFSDKYQQGVMCVGCGRCIRQCPANIDIREVCERMNG